MHLCLIFSLDFLVCVFSFDKVMLIISCTVFSTFKICLFEIVQGKLRVCIDSKDLNGAINMIKRERYHLKTNDEIVERLP